MTFPPITAGWDYQTMVEIIKRYEYEPGEFDYKEVLNAGGQAQVDALKSLRRTVCSMANADGGYILFGIRDRSQQVRTPEDRIVGIPLQGDLLKNFWDKIKNIQPDVRIEHLPGAVPLPDDPTKGIFVVRIPQSQRRPHMVQDTGVFFRRGAGGTAEIMKFHEIRELMIHTEERLRQIALLRLELIQYRRLAERLLTATDRQLQGSIRRFDASGFKPLLAAVCGLLPQSGPLLGDLLEVPSLAGDINRLLDIPQDEGQPARDIAYGGPPARTWRERVHEELRELDGLCERCAKQLESIFGPIGKT